MNYPGIREKSVKWHVLEYLQGKDWTFAGPICRAVHELTGAIESYFANPK